jgi:serine/threonine-protein kinase
VASGTDPSATSPTALTSPGGPREFGRYALLDRLGSGGMADVFLALANGPFDAKKLVVLKCPRAFDHEYAGMFMDEARLAMRLNHPNVVQTYDVGVHDGSFFLAMEYLEGQPLHRIIAAMAREERWLSHAQLARIMSDALAGLHYAHELCDYDGTPLQIVHRDVSPHNLFVTYEGHVKVVDFGIAKATLNVVSTAAGAVKGKLAYMAPEHAMSGTVDRRADIFAMGIVLWELIARRRLITGVQSAERLNKLLTMEFPPLSVEAPDVHPLLEVVAMRALQRDPRERYQTAGEMREALEAYIGACGQPVRASDIGSTTGALFAVTREQMATKIRAHIKATTQSEQAAAAAAAAQASEAETEKVPAPPGFGAPPRASSRAASEASVSPSVAPRFAPPVMGPGVPPPAMVPGFGPRSVPPPPSLSAPPPPPVSPPRSSPSLTERTSSQTATVVMTSTAATAAPPPRHGMMVLVAAVAALAAVAMTLVVLALAKRAGPAAANPALEGPDASESATSPTATTSGAGRASPAASSTPSSVAPPATTSPPPIVTATAAPSPSPRHGARGGRPSTSTTSR